MRNLLPGLLGSLALVACSSSSNSKQIDAPPMGTVTISGVASSVDAGGRTPQMGVVVAAMKVSDDSLIAMATSDAAGAFSISAPTGGAVVDGYLKATKTGFKDTYLYPPAPLSADFSGATVLLLAPGTQTLANQLAGAAAPDPTKGWIGVLVVDAANMGIAGVVVTATPTGEIHYNSSAGLPQAQAMATAMDGIGYVMNVPAGQVSVGATMSGATFKTHSINARADKITLTLVTQ